MRGAALVDRRPEALDVRLARVIRLPRVHHSLIIIYYLLGGIYLTPYLRSIQY